jgi:plasmid maintenance system antidote protein VapI
MPTGRKNDGRRWADSPRVAYVADAIETGLRIKAALAIRGRTSAEVAPELNISGRTLERIIAGTRTAREWELHRLAEVLDVPPWFIEEGLEGRRQDPALGDVLDVAKNIERKLDVDDLAGRLKLLEAEISRLARLIDERIAR